MRNSGWVILMVLGLMCSSPAWAAGAKATITGTMPASPISGEVTLTEESGGLRIKGELANVPPGKHGFHIHEKGTCAEEGKAAGGHFNPDKMDHGYMPKDGPMHAHPGDMGNIEAGDGGKASIDVLLPGVTLKDGKYAVSGKAIIVHEKADDFSQPTGNAGGRIGCGIIETGA